MATRARTASKPTRRGASTDPALACIDRRVLDARPDTVDFRDRMFEPTLVEVPVEVPLGDYLSIGVPVLDQGREGACTGFGLATVANCLLRKRRIRPDPIPASPRMFYEMARRYDEWEGEHYSGSSCRGAMKGWHHHGVCSAELWPYRPTHKPEPFTDERSRDAERRPLGAYFRVNHRDLVALHAAIAEVGVLYSSAAVHEGWDGVSARSGRIRWRGRERVFGFHAFAVVAYDDKGFWLQNSWGTGWGKDGLAHIGYDDWLEHAADVWVGRLAVPIELRRASSAAAVQSRIAGQAVGYSQAELRPHVVSLGNDGLLRAQGRFGNTPAQLDDLFANVLPAATAGWKKKRVLLYAHGGLVSEESALQRIADYRGVLLEHEIWPIGLVWKSDFASTIGNILADALNSRRSEGLLDQAKDFMLDRIDDTLEPLARALGGRALWQEMKENALAATSAAKGGMRRLAERLAAWMAADGAVELHLLGHSAGSILLAPLVRLLTERGAGGLGRTIASLTLWAPAITCALFKDTCAAPLRAGRIERAALFTLTDKAERDDDCARIYNKSLLYLVAHALEHAPRSWIDRSQRDGTPLLGLARFLEGEQADPDIARLIADGRLDWIQAPTRTQPIGSPAASEATTHIGFDDDQATVQALIARVIGRKGVIDPVSFRRTPESARSHRRQLEAAT